MPAEFSPPAMQFARLDGRSVVADFGGGAMTSDAGALLLGATDRAVGLVDRFAACFSDGRAAGRVMHDVATLPPTTTNPLRPQPRHRVPPPRLRHRPEGDAMPTRKPPQPTQQPITERS